MRSLSLNSAFLPEEALNLSARIFRFSSLLKTAFVTPGVVKKRSLTFHCYFNNFTVQKYATEN